MPYRTEAAAVLAMSRDAERRMSAAAPDSPEVDRLTDEWASLRIEYARLIDLADVHDRTASMPRPIGPSTGDPKVELADRSGAMLDELEHLKETEKLKRQEPISTPSFHALADEVTASSRRVYELGAELNELGEESETGEETIEDVERTA